MKNDKVLQLLSLAMRAGKVSSGEFSTEEAVKAGKATLVIVANDSSDKTKKHFADMCSYRNIPLKVYGDKNSLGHYIGKEFRASVSVNDKGFSDRILSEMCANERTEVV